MDWEFASGEISALTVSTKTGFQVVSSTELNAQYTDPTLMASIMSTGVTFTAGGVRQIVVIGLIAWDDINDTIPPAAELPGPITNGNLDWIMRVVHQNPSGVALSSTMPGDRSKARRRLGSSRTILCVVETNAQATPSSTLVDVRCLIKE